MSQEVSVIFYKLETISKKDLNKKMSVSTQLKEKFIGEDFISWLKSYETLQEKVFDFQKEAHFGSLKHFYEVFIKNDDFFDDLYQANKKDRIFDSSFDKYVKLGNEKVIQAARENSDIFFESKTYIKVFCWSRTLLWSKRNAHYLANYFTTFESDAIKKLAAEEAYSAPKRQSAANEAYSPQSNITDFSEADDNQNEHRYSPAELSFSFHENEDLPPSESRISAPQSPRLVETIDVKVPLAVYKEVSDIISNYIAKTLNQ